MKNRMIALLLVLALLASVAVAPVSAEETQPASATDTAAICPCGCGQKLDAITWTAWNVNEAGEPTAGHYYLDGDYVQDGQKEIMAGDRVVLDLRGYTITTKSYSRLLLVYGRFHLLDTVGGGRFMAKVSGGAFGGVVMLSTNEVNDALFELCSGTITIDDDNKGSRRGGLIQVSQTATFRMTGGMLLNGTTVSTAYPDTKEPGGCVAGVSSECTIEILGGKIIGGESATHGGNIYNVGTTILKNCHIVGGTAAKSGGNIYQDGGSLTVENCVIESGVSNDTSTGGGNIYATGGSTVAFQDSTVRNGWAAYCGGNIGFGTTTATIENTKIEAGVAKNRGNNLYTYTNTELTIKDCELPGDIGFTGKALKLEGKVKIGLLNHGLRMDYGNTVGAPLDAGGLSEGSEIYVTSKNTFTTAGANPAYFKGAIRTVITETEDGLVGTQAANGERGGYCPHCGEQVTWKLFSTTDSLIQNCLKDSATDTDPACTGNHIETGHYYLGSSNSKWTQYYVGIYRDLADIKDVVIDLAGYSLTASSARAFYIRGSSSNPQQSSLTLLDSYGNGKVSGACSNNQPGGVIYNESSNLTIYGGTYIYKPVEGRNVTGGGVILNGNSFTMHGGTLDGSQFTYTDASTTEKTYSYNGGCLMQYNGSQHDFTMTAGRMIGGTAQAGGCAYFGYNNQTTITGGQFDSGKTNVGGGANIRMYGNDTNKSAVFHMSGASVRGGRVEVTGTGGGNLSLQYGTITVSDTFIEGGYAAAYGGNILTGILANITFTDCIVEGGYSAAQGGNVHISATNTHSTWDNCLFLNGSATTGGNLNGGNGYITIKGGQYLYGKARTAAGGNMVTNAGNVSATSDNYSQLIADEEGNAPLIAGGYAKTYGGNLYVGGVTDMQAARLVNGNAGTSGLDLFVAKGSKQSNLTVGPGVTGKIIARFNSGLYGEGVYGQPIDRTACETLNAQIIIDNYNNALLCAKDGKLYVGAVAVIAPDGAMTWYTDGTSAAAACPEGSCVRFYQDGEVVLGKDCALDVNGNTVNVSGAYTAGILDTAGGGKAVLAAQTSVPSEAVSPDGIRYLTQIDGVNVTAHPLDMKITGVSLRPSAAGIYYTGRWIGDDVTSQLVESYGVAVSTAVIPDKDFMALGSKCLWTTQTDTLDGSTNDYSVLISGIMKTLAQDPDRTAAENKQNGETRIHAVAYVKLKSGDVLLSDSVSYSLYDVMKDIDGRIVNDPIHYRKYTNTMRSFHDQWADFGMGDWSFDKVITPPEDDVIDILMVGNSFCYYFVEELVGLAAADGIKMRVCNVYYSGCKMSQHYNWWMAGDAPYQFFETTAEKGRVQTNNVSLEWCLAQGEWDYISIQSLNITTNDPQQLMLDNKLYLDTFYGYFREQFPKATMTWHQTWSYAVGTAGNGTVTTAETQAANHQRNHDAARLICQEYDLLNVPTGDAWAIIRAGGYDKLCARIGKGTNHEGDYYHDGDVGGGQYLNACVWYEIITGNSCVGNAYRPVYKYNGTEIPLVSEMTYERLQEAAHQAATAQ